MLSAEGETTVLCADRAKLEAAPWAVRARRALEGVPVIVVGIGVEQMRCFERAGCRIVAAISVLPAGADADAPGDGPVLSLNGRTRDVLELVVSEYALTIQREGTAVAAFLDRVDEHRGSVVVSYLPMPLGVCGGRRAWAQESAVARRLETKTVAQQILASAVPTIPAEVVDGARPLGWWEEAFARWQCSRLVVQDAGLSGGGARTFLCDRPADAAAVEGDHLLAMPFVDGEPCNVMGSVDADGCTMTLPPSRQLICPDEAGHPLYAGNVVGRFSDREVAAIARDAGRVGASLAREGFTGPFGVDFIRAPDGRRLYHDLNPRMNGVVDSLALYVDEWGTMPLQPLLLARIPWTVPERQAFQRGLDAAVRGRPVARLFLARTMDRGGVIRSAPAAGVWKVDVDAPGLTMLGTSGGLGDVAGDRVLLQPKLAAGTEFRRGDRLVGGDLFCAPETLDRLMQRHGNATPRKLLDALVR